MTERPCTCDRALGPPFGVRPDGTASCHPCWLWHHSPGHRALWGGEPVAGSASLSLPGRSGCPSCPGHVELKPLTELVPGLRDPIPEPAPDPLPSGWAREAKVRDRHVAAWRWLLRQDVPPPAAAEGEGALICGGGRYWPMAVVAARMVRDVCSLPIQLWHRGALEPVRLEDLDGLDGVTVHDATQFPARVLGGWEVKTQALLHCGWKRVIYLDADAYPVADPTPLLALAGAHRFAFWTEAENTAQPLRWEAHGMRGPEGVPPVQGGQLAIDLVAFRRELVLAHWANQHSDYTYGHQFGDQDSWRVALAATGGAYRCLGEAPWSWPAYVIPWAGAPLVVHRAKGKWWGRPSDARAPHLPGEDRAWAHRRRLAPEAGPR